MPLILSSSPPRPATPPASRTVRDAGDLSPEQWRRVSDLYSTFLLAMYHHDMVACLNERLDKLERDFADEALRDHPRRPAALAEYADKDRQQLNHAGALETLLGDMGRNWARMDGVTRRYVASVWGCDPGMDGNAMKAWAERQLATGGAWCREELEAPW